MHLNIAKSGFTLIELMVVIAIFGILASTTLASISEINLKARNLERNLIVKSYIQTLEGVRTSKGSYPNPDTLFVACLGDYVNDRCGLDGQIYEQSAMNNFLQPGLSSLKISQPVTDDNGQVWSGIVYWCYRGASPGRCEEYVISWRLESYDQNCLGGLVINTDGITECTFWIE